MVTSALEYELLMMLAEADVPATLPVVEQVRCLVRQVTTLQAQLQEQSKRKPRNLLLASLDERREDVLLLLSDACLDEAAEAEERGEYDRAGQLRQEAKGWGWLGMSHKWPTQLQGQQWFWDRAEATSQDIFSDQLPMSSIMLPSSQRFPSCRAALEWVVGLIADGWEPRKAN